MQDYEKIRKIKRKAIAYANFLWDEKPSDGAYECNQCGYQVGWKEEGSSSYLDWIRCKSCTDRTFPEKMGVSISHDLKIILIFKTYFMICFGSLFRSLSICGQC